MRRLALLVFSLPLFAGVIPDRYIVQLSGESVAQHIARTVPQRQRREALLGDVGVRYRSVVRTGQDAARTRLESRGAEVVGSVDTVANALFVHMAARDAARLRRVRGVRRVMPERTFGLTLDHAVALHKISEAWNYGGAYPQGQSVKVGMIDTGIDISHPGFRDAGFQAPAGFPKVNAASDKAFTNEKVIVARSYASLFQTTDPDPSVRDHVGHGTATAMAAAGVQNTGPLATITGAAPLAYIGIYKVFGSPGVNDFATESAILKAVDDAVTDGMDVINLSLGGLPAPRPADDVEVQSLENAVAAGVIVVVSAGNTGPDPNTMASPATAPSVISVGASNNDRQFAAPVTVAGQGPYASLLAVEPLPSKPITAPLVDISASLNPDGMACSPMPPNSLNGSIALILRGVCHFDVKLNNAQQAGAVAALVYTDQARPDAIFMDVAAATLPASMVSYQDGLTIKQLAAKPVQTTMSFSTAAVPADANSIAVFSARGPNVDFGIKPDLLAVGENFYTAAESFDPQGTVYGADGYVTTQGTSFSAPLVAGSAAVLKAARPGFTALQYKSLLINSAAGAFAAPAQQQHLQDAGAGLLDLSTAVRSTLSVYPVSISFGVGAGDNQLAPINLRLSNIGYGSEKFLISAQPLASAPAPVPSVASVQLDSDTYFDVSLKFTASGLAPGAYEGFIVIQGTNSGIETRVPYWYGVPSTTPAHITVLQTPDTPPKAGASVAGAILFRVTDASGIVPTGIQPTVTVSSGTGSVQRVRSQDLFYPGVWGVDVTMGSASGSTTVFHITAGALNQDVSITAQ